MRNETNIFQKEITDQDKDKNEVKKFSPELQPYTKEALEFIELGKGFFNLLAGNPEPPLEFILSEKNFYFDHKNNQVGVDLKRFAQMKKEGLKLNQILFAVGHEIKHFNDMEKDPEAYLKNFDDNERKGKEMSKEVLEIWKKRFPEKTADLTKEDVAKYIQSIWHDFYNCLDDIFVNRGTVNDSPRFRGDKKQLFNSDVVNFYRDFLFPKSGKEADQKESQVNFADYSKLPRCRQFMYSLLRKFMVTDEEIIITPEVRKELEGFLDKFSQKAGKNIKDEIYEITRPSSKFEEKQHLAGSRYSWIEKHIEPILKKLFLEDVKDQPLPNFKKAKKGSGEKGRDGKGKPQKDESSDVWENPNVPESPFSKDDIKNYIESKKGKAKKDKQDRAKKGKEGKQDIQQKIDQAVRNENYKNAAEAGLDKKDVDDYEKLKKEVEPYKKELADVFGKIMENIQERISLEWIKYSQKGKFNADSFISKYGDAITTGRMDAIPFESLDVYDRQEFSRKLALFPNQIRFRLVLDGSGSMQGEKIKETRKLAILIIEALKDFEYQVNLKFRLNKPFYVDTQVIMFGNEGKSEIVKEFDSKDKEKNRQISRYKAIRKVTADYGVTYDDEAWEKIKNDINYSEKLKKGEFLELCFELTDGASDTCNSTRREINEVEAKGAKVLGFLIGKDGENIFDEIWNKEKSEKRGFQVEIPSDLAKVIAKRFAQEISNQKIKVVNMDEGEEGEMFSLVKDKQ